ncbi:MAG: biopolymer transporter ExbD [Burkholderiaceae bacterium]
MQPEFARTTQTLPALAIRAAPRRRPSLGLTPLIDVVFILLLFFMLATSFGQWRFIEIIGSDAEASPGATSSKGRTLLISLRAEQVLVSGRAMRADDLAAALRAVGRGRYKIEHVILDVGDSVALQRLIDTLETIRAADLPTPTLRNPAPSGD